jgi:oligoendopeptidase F
MFDTLPKDAKSVMAWEWSQFEPYVSDLLARDLTVGALESYLADWTRLAELLDEMGTRLHLATAVDTTDEQAEERFNAFLNNIYPNAMMAEQELKTKLVAAGLEPPAKFEVPMRNIRAEVELFREENVPLFIEEQKLSNAYDKVIGAQTVEWEGEEVTLSQLQPVLKDQDRAARERAWRLGMVRRLDDRGTLNEMWQQFMEMRQQMAANAGYDDYRSFRWKQFARFDYTPEDCFAFHDAIEQVVVPAAKRIYARRREQLGVASLRPWDTDVDPLGLPPLKPFETGDELRAKTAAIFARVDPQLGAYFDVMRRENLLDLDNRKGKAPGGFCTMFSTERKPFIFMNAVGLHDDVQTLLHEGGHSFHVFEASALPYNQQLAYSMEFAEVASMAMELLAAPYLTASEGGFYSDGDAARARIEHLEGSILFWPYMAVVDAFQQWVYENHDAATDPANCDAKWGELWDRFMAGVDWAGLDAEKVTGWHRKLHIFQLPFYYVEYGLAQLGAVQVWANALKDQAGAVASYREALALGGTAPLPVLYETAGAKLAFDAGTLGEAVELMERTIAELGAA